MLVLMYTMSHVHPRARKVWSVTEALSLQREYELLGLTPEEMADRHRRSVFAIISRLESEDYYALGPENYVREMIDSIVHTTVAGTGAKNDGAKNDGAKNDRTKNDRTKNDCTQNDSTKNDSTKNDRPNNDTEKSISDRIRNVETSLTEIREVVTQMMELMSEDLKKKERTKPKRKPLRERREN